MPPVRPRILVTGFEPFAGADDNPSARIIQSLSGADGMVRDGLVLDVLPVSASRLPEQLSSLLEAHRPDVVLGLGESRGCGVVRVERMAANVLDCDKPDNDGRSLRGMKVIADGPPSYRATLSADAARDSIIRAGIKCECSDNAGAYICNQMLFLSLHWAARQTHSPRVGFLHVPSLPRQNTAGPNCPAMPLDVQVRAVTAVLDSLRDGEK